MNNSSKTYPRRWAKWSSPGYWHSSVAPYWNPPIGSLGSRPPLANPWVLVLGKPSAKWNKHKTINLREINKFTSIFSRLCLYFYVLSLHLLFINLFFKSVFFLTVKVLNCGLSMFTFALYYFSNLVLLTLMKSTTIEKQKPGYR